MTLTVRLPEGIESQLTRFCETMGMSKSQVVQTALKDWFAKPSAPNTHPLLAFAQAASSAEPAADWAGPYSKERLRARVLASGAAHAVHEPAAGYVAPARETATRRKAASKKSTVAQAQAQAQAKPGQGAEVVALVQKTGGVDGAERP